MATGIVGNQTTPTAGFIGRGDGTNQVWGQFTMPSPGGRITDITAYFDAWTGSGNGKVCVWDAGGNLLGAADVGSVGGDTSGAGAQHWHTGTFSGTSCPYIKGGATLFLGFWMPTANGFNTSSESGGSSSMKAAGGSPANLAGGGSTGIGALGVYANYVKCLRKIRRAGAWVESPKRKRRAGAWVIGPRYVRRSGAWVQVQ